VLDPGGDRFAGALWVLALAAALVVARRSAWPALLALTCWSVTFPQARFLAASLAFGAVAGGAALASLWGRRAWRPLVAAAAVACLAHDASSAWHRWLTWQGRWWEAAAGLIDADEYRDALLDYPRATEAARAILPPGTHLLMIGEARCFPSPVPCESASVLDVPPLFALLRSGAGPDDVAAWWRARGVGAVLLRPNEWGRLAGAAPHWGLDEAQRAVLMQALARHARPVMSTEHARSILFAVAPR
jgi:hypothetical protein